MLRGFATDASSYTYLDMGVLFRVSPRQPQQARVGVEVYPLHGDRQAQADPLARC